MPNDTPHIAPVDIDAIPTTTPRNKWLSLLVVCVRIIVGATFIFSGVVKLIDPVGTMYKIEDYLQAFNLSSISAVSYFVAVVLALVEFVLGFNALLGSYLRTTPLLLLIFMAIMTPLTLYLAIANPISDCGCFGDVITLTNWQTFGKNIVLLLLVIFLLRYNVRARSLFHREIHAFIVVWVSIFGLAQLYVAAMYSPILDFRPFKVGTDLSAAYFGDEDSVVEYDFVYTKDGVLATFALDSIPDEESGWQYVERRERQQAKPSKDNSLLEHFVVYQGDEDVTEEVLSHQGYLFMLLSEDLTKADDDDINVVHELYDYTREYGYPFYAVTASSPDEIEEWCDNTGAEYPFYFMDRTTIRTIQRANPYLLVLKDGVIYHKYYISHMPNEELLIAPVEEIEAYATMSGYNATYRAISLAILLILPIVLLYFTERIALFALRRFRRWRETRREKKENI